MGKALKPLAGKTCRYLSNVKSAISNFVIFLALLLILLIKLFQFTLDMIKLIANAQIK